MISIQKQILLLSEFHFTEFQNYLISLNADLPNKLISTIRFSKTHHESDDLCVLVYGDCEEKTKKKFLQLTHYTFKLSGFLSRNYPNYLKHNIQKIEELLSYGENKKANEIADWLIDIAERIEDYTTLIEITKFRAQQCFITEQKEAYRYHQKVNEYIELEKIKNSIYLYLRENLFFKGKENLAKKLTNKSLTYFDAYLSHTSISISLLARFGKYYELSFLSHPKFYDSKTIVELDILEKDFLNNTHLCFHYLDDMYFKILGLRLQIGVNNNKTESILQEVKKMNAVSSFLKYWTSYINIPEMFSFSVQLNHYLNHYAFFFKDDYHKKLPKDIKENISELRRKIELELSKNIWIEGNYNIKLINLKSIYAGVLLLGDYEDIEKSIHIIETTFESNQQIPFQKYLDGMFVTLIMGYFALKQYDRVIFNYKRYKKNTANQIVMKENDLTIDAYYFTSQYIKTSRKQYKEKLTITLENSKDFIHLRDLIKELIVYNKISIII